MHFMYVKYLVLSSRNIKNKYKTYRQYVYDFYEYIDIQTLVK